MIYVVDSNDRDRVEECASELHAMLAFDELRDAAILVFANKQDLPGSMAAADVCEKLQLNKLRGREWYIQPCVATTGQGLHEGLDWLSRTLTNQS